VCGTPRAGTPPSQRASTRIRSSVRWGSLRLVINTKAPTGVLIFTATLPVGQLVTVHQDQNRTVRPDLVVVYAGLARDQDLKRPG
jgi:hypothetical protein